VIDWISGATFERELDDDFIRSSQTFEVIARIKIAD
jgi:hypothetical protein